MRFSFLLCVLSALVAFHLCHSVEGAIFVREMTCAQADNCSLETAERIVIYETAECLPIMGMPSSALVRTTNDSTLTLCVFPNSTACEGIPLCSGPFANDSIVAGDLFPEPLRMESTQYIRLLWWNDREEKWGSPELEKLLTPKELGEHRTLAERHGFCSLDHTQYGRWCGSGHGGLQDCCNGKPCPACSLETDNVTMACQRQCRPADLLDLACAYHDVCTFRYDLAEQFPGSRCTYNLAIVVPIDANYCECDCKLMKAMRRAMCPRQWADICQHQKSCQGWLFGEAASCWYYDGHGPVCNRGMQKISVWNFCD